MPSPPSAQILIVEDDADFRIALCRLFSQAGYEVGLAANGLEAIDYLEHHTPCAVVLDLLMPGIVGQELLEHMRAAPELSVIPVAIISGSPELAPPGYRVFPKPVDHAALLAFVGTTCVVRGSPGTALGER